MYCIYCKSTEVFPLMNDGGSVLMCRACERSFPNPWFDAERFQGNRAPSCPACGVRAVYNSDTTWSTCPGCHHSFYKGL